MNNDFGKYQELVNNWAKKNDMVFVLPVFLDLFKQIEKEGRVDFLNSVEFKNLIQSAESKGAIKELEKIQEISFKDNLNKEQTLCEILQYIGKRLKSLENGIDGEQK